MGNEQSKAASIYPTPELCLTNSLQPAPKDKPKLGDSLPQNAINPHSLGEGCTSLLLHLHEAGAGSNWDQEKGEWVRTPQFPHQTSCEAQLVEQGGLLCSLPVAVTWENVMRGINPK